MAVTVIRTLILYLVIIISFRFMGKRQLGELEPGELVVAVLVSNMAAQPMQDTGIPLIYGLLPVFILLSCEIILSGISLKSPKFSAFVSGKPSMIIENGKINQFEMHKNRLTPDELGITLRKQSVSDISTVQYAVLETDGSLSIQLYPEASPATPKDLGITVHETGYPMIVINDGHTLSDNLKLLGYNERWLLKQIKSRGVSDIKDVYYMSVDKTGKIYFAARDESGKSGGK